jgi:acyl transferase domain-containing protein
VVADGPRPLRPGPGQPLRALSNSFGFGGHNATLALSALPVAAGDGAGR